MSVITPFGVYIVIIGIHYALCFFSFVVRRREERERYASVFAVNNDLFVRILENKLARGRVVNSSNSIY